MSTDNEAQMLNYKQLHERFMQNHNGTTIVENMAIITPAPIMVYFVCLLKFKLIHIIPSTNITQLLMFIIEFISIVCFLILHFTFLCNYVQISSIIFLISFISMLNNYLKNFNKVDFKITRKKIEPRPSITYFRSIVSLMTCICILAVDFHIFPRRFAKTETFGYGLMDTGVGFYIVTNGIVYKQNDTRNGVLKAVMSCAPLILLGIIRCISLEALDYQKHVTEYGLHWNFFFTLAFVKIIGAVLMSMYPRRFVLMSVFSALLHQFILTIVAENWVLAAPRTNFITANKEGLTSLMGYISLYLCSAALGKFLDKPVLSLIDYIRHGINTCLWAFIFSCLTWCLHLAFNISRRLANLTYITWIISMSLYGLSLSIFCELALRVSVPERNENIEILVPTIFQAINYNSLFFFLLSNILTGLVNLSINTFYASNLFSLVTLVLYKFCTCSILYLLFLKKIKLKCW